jgi:hypothetical protein
LIPQIEAAGRKYLKFQSPGAEQLAVIRFKADEIAVRGTGRGKVPSIKVKGMEPPEIGEQIDYRTLDTRYDHRTCTSQLYRRVRYKSP